MKLDDYVRALAACLAALPRERRKLSEASGVSLIPRAPGWVSLAGRSPNGQLTDFGSWLEALPQAARDVRSWSYETLHAPRFAFQPEDFVTLVDAQAAHEAVWERLFTLVAESAALNEEPEVTRANLRRTLLDADGGWWGLMAEQLLQEAQIECRVNEGELLVPPALREVFETAAPFFEPDPYDFPDIEDPLERRRAQLRSQLSGGGVVPVLNAQPWSCYVWQTADAAEPADEAAAREIFRQALIAIEAFAAGRESPFAEAFRLALFCLGLEPGEWDAAFGDAVNRRLKEGGFSETALEVFSRHFGPVAELARLGWPGERRGAAAALAVADVFGGMGSWNDQIFDEDYDEYAGVSGALAEALRRLWHALLAPWGPYGLS